MMEYLVPLVSSFTESGIFQHSLFHIFILGFISCVPNIIRYILQWR